MRDFSQLLDALAYTHSRTAKLKMISAYPKRRPDPCPIAAPGLKRSCRALIPNGSIIRP